MWAMSARMCMQSLVALRDFRELITTTRTTTTRVAFWDPPSDRNSVCLCCQVYVWPLVHISQMWTVWITVLVAFNRYVAICRPFQAIRICTMRQSRLQVLVSAVSIIVYNIPRFLEHRLEFNFEVIAHPGACLESVLTLVCLNGWDSVATNKKSVGRYFSPTWTEK